LVGIVLYSSIRVSLRSTFWGSTARFRRVFGFNCWFLGGICVIVQLIVQSAQFGITRFADHTVASLLQPVVHFHRRRQLVCLQLVATGGHLQMMDKVGFL